MSQDQNDFDRTAVMSEEEREQILNMSREVGDTMAKAGVGMAGAVVKAMPWQMKVLIGVGIVGGLGIAALVVVALARLAFGG